MTLMEVRCCCQPQKLLGYLPAPARGKTKGEFWIPARFPGFGYWRNNPSDPIELVPAVAVVLKVEQFGEFVRFGESLFDVERRLTPAYKAEDVSIETLRQIPEFLEAMPHG